MDTKKKTIFRNDYSQRLRTKDCQQVRNGHGHENHVRGCSHVLFAEDYDDQEVANDGENEDDRHDVSVDGDGQRCRPIPCRPVDVVAGLLVEASSQGMDLQE